MAYVNVHDLDSARTELVKTLTEVVDKDKLELELREKGSCVCDNYMSYQSTLSPGAVVAAMMPFEDCVNCRDVCSVIMTIAINNSPNHFITPEAVDQRINAEIEQARCGDYVRHIWVDGEGFVKETLDDTINRMEKFRTEIHEAVASGRAQKTVDAWYTKHYGFKEVK